MQQLLDRNSQLVHFVAIVGDLLCFAISLMVLAFVQDNMSFHSFEPEVFFSHFALLVVCYLPSIMLSPIILFNRLARADQILVRVFWMMNFTILFFVLVLLITKFQDVDTWLIYFYLLSFVLVFLSRLTIRAVLKRSRAWGKNTFSLVFVGWGYNIRALKREFTSNTSTGYRLRGYFNDVEVPVFSETVPYLGRVEDAIPYLKEHHVDELYCSLNQDQSDVIMTLINFCENNLIRFYSVPDVRNYLRRQMDYELMGNVPVLTLREEPLLSASNRVKKRVFDVVVSIAFLLLVYWWVYLIVATIIKITSPGPVYFKQLRNGMNGKEFTCIKFRSMRVNKDAGKVQATKNDPRKTKFGNFMRKTSIDELPQFLNVLKGDMSLVGPRPHMLSHTKEYSGLIDKYMVRHLVKPGITGLAQVTGFRGETKELSQMEGRVRQDIWYVENWSFFLDIRILFLTFYNAIRGDKQAY
jgi:putative colanic acid biosynthesis UDP-glucose lipid carrier transferase